VQTDEDPPDHGEGQSEEEASHGPSITTLVVVVKSYDVTMGVRTPATRDRLMDAVLDLVSEHGYARTSVGAIERQAGMAPRSGALYQHFEGKDGLLRAAVERELSAVDELGSVIAMLPLGDLRSELTLLARWNLASLERRSRLSRLVRRESAHLPPDLLERLYDRLVAQPYDLIVGWLRQRFTAAGADVPDLHAIALVLIEPMTAYRSMRQTFGRVLDDMDDERFIEGWVDIALAVAARHGVT
jgi:AcrR family transcriptional regulator